MSKWKSQLLVTSTGAPRPLLANAITALREAPPWAMVLAYDEFARETILKASPPWDIKLVPWQQRAWGPHDDLLTAEWLQREGIAVNVAVAAQAVEAVSRDRSFHPVVDYLDSLQHDRKLRLETWLAEYLGAGRSNYHEEVGTTMMIAAVARIIVQDARSIRSRFSKAHKARRSQPRLRPYSSHGLVTSSPISARKTRRCKPAACGALRFPNSTQCPERKSPASSHSSAARRTASGRRMAVALLRARGPAPSGAPPTQPAISKTRPEAGGSSQ